jgi:hypothetical protein
MASMASRHPLERLGPHSVWINVYFALERR